MYTLARMCRARGADCMCRPPNPEEINWTPSIADTFPLPGEAGHFQNQYMAYEARLQAQAERSGFTSSSSGVDDDASVVPQSAPRPNTHLLDQAFSGGGAASQEADGSHDIAHDGSTTNDLPFGSFGDAGSTLFTSVGSLESRTATTTSICTCASFPDPATLAFTSPSSVPLIAI